MFRSTMTLTLACLWVGVLTIPQVWADDEVRTDDEEGFREIFNGEDLSGWNGNSDYWHVEEGAITGQTTEATRLRQNTFLVWRQGELDDFELRLQYRIEGGNSGIQYRSSELPDQQWVIRGYQADIDSGDEWSGALYEERGRGTLARRGERVDVSDDPHGTTTESLGDAAALNSHIRQGEWNDYHIIARGHHITHRINGHTMIEVTDADFPGSLQGLLALQLHAGPPMKVQFRNIRLKRLPLEERRRKLVFVAGGRSHGFMAHEYRAGCLLLEDCLHSAVPNLLTQVYTNGWPSDPTAFDNADAICVFTDGGNRHPANRHMEQLEEAMSRGVGLACLHYAVEARRTPEGAQFLDWLGGYFETNWSVNPKWTLTQPLLAEGHPITRGVGAFAVHDEWYYHMRFREESEAVTAILSAVPTAESLDREDGPRSGNPHVREAVAAEQPQAVAWATDREDGGRGFGFTGGHYHWNWANDEVRQLMLNALCWVSQIEVPEEGVESVTPSLEEIRANQDDRGEFTEEQFEELLRDWGQTAPE